MIGARTPGRDLGVIGGSVGFNAASVFFSYGWRNDGRGGEEGGGKEGRVLRAGNSDGEANELYAMLPNNPNNPNKPNNPDSPNMHVTLITLNNPYNPSNPK